MYKYIIYNKPFEHTCFTVCIAQKTPKKIIIIKRGTTVSCAKFRLLRHPLALLSRHKHKKPLAKCALTTHT